MTPIGHLATSYVLSKSVSNKINTYFLIGSLWPDIDIIFIFSSHFNEYHRVLTHNIFFILVSSILIPLISRHLILKNIILFSLGGFLHLFLDSILDTNPSNGIGVTILYPLSFESFSPFNLLSGYVNDYTWSTPLKFMLSNLKTLFYEIPFIIVGVYIFYRNRL